MRDRITLPAQLLDPLLERGGLGFAHELGDRRVERDQHLQRGFASAVVVEVEARAKRELLRGQRPLAAAQERRQPRLRVENPRSALPPPEHDQLTRVGPQPVGDLFAAPVADPGDERLMALHRIQVGIGRGQPEGVKRAVQHGQIRGELLLARAAQPGRRLVFVRELLADVDHRRAAGGNGRRLRLRWSLRLPRSAPDPARAPLDRAKRRDHEHMGRGAVGLGVRRAKQVAPVGRTERPRQLDLAEAEEGRYRSGRGWALYPAPPTLIAYLLGAIGTIGSGSCAMWLIRFVHWLADSRLVIARVSCLLLPYSGV